MQTYSHRLDPFLSRDASGRILTACIETFFSFTRIRLGYKCLSVIRVQMALEVVDLQRIDDRGPSGPQILDRFLENCNDFCVRVFGIHERTQDAEPRVLERIRP